MKNYIINDNGKVRICNSNIAKMNLFEWMYYRRYILINQVPFILKQFKEGIELICASLINILLYLLYPIIGIFAIRKAKKEVKRSYDKKNN